MPATTYLGNLILNAFLRGQTIAAPAAAYVSLHTADPGITGASEVSTGTWPAYVRKDVKGAGAFSAAFSAATTKETLNAVDLLWPAYDGAGTITITHFAIWDAATAGNCLFVGELKVDATDPDSADDHKTLGLNDEFMLYATKLGVEIT